MSALLHVGQQQPSWNMVHQRQTAQQQQQQQQ
jgi:hypothetical protein